MSAAVGGSSAILGIIDVITIVIKTLEPIQCVQLPFDELISSELLPYDEQPDYIIMKKIKFLKLIN